MRGCLRQADGVTHLSTFCPWRSDRVTLSPIALAHNNLWAITQGQRRRCTATVLALFAANGCIFTAPLIGKAALDGLLAGDISQMAPWLRAPLSQLGWPLAASYLALSGLATVAITSLGGFCQYLQTQLSARTSETIVRDLRDALYRRLHHVPASFYDTADTGDLVQRCSSDVDTVRGFLSGDAIELARCASMLLTVTPILFWLHAGLAWVTLALVPLIVVFAHVFFKRAQRVFEAMEAAESEMTAVLQENLTGIRVVRAFARQDYEISRFATKNTALLGHYQRFASMWGTYWALSDFLCLVQLGLTLLIGARWTIAGHISLGTLFAFTSSAAMVIWPVRSLGNVLIESSKALVALGRIRHILSSPEEPLAPAPAAARADGELHFEHVTFGYDPARPVIDDLSLHVHAGETLAIVGAPGAGKTTLIRLLLRWYGPQRGDIRLDGTDIATFSHHWLRHQIGVVLQDPFLFSRTIEENLRVGKPDAAAEHLERATRDAALHDAISGFPDGYQTLVGERGVTLSGGQRQRLALARALLKEPAVLVLDDSLSAVDTGTEAHILAALRARKGRHTTLVIAHRLSSLVNADRILVLERGRCVQLGDHATLAQIEGPYRRLLQIQTELDTEISADTRVLA
jgi:ATP-binding cassette subfamily B protein